MLTKQQVENWDTDHLADAATHWNQLAAQVEDSFAAVHREARAPGGTVFQGQAATALRDYTERTNTVADTVAGHFRAAAQTALTAEDELGQARDDSKDAISGADADQFTVPETLVPLDDRTPMSGWEGQARASRKAIHEGNIMAATGKLEALDVQYRATLGSHGASVEAMGMGGPPLAPPFPDPAPQPPSPAQPGGPVKYNPPPTPPTVITAAPKEPPKPGFPGCSGLEQTKDFLEIFGGLVAAGGTGVGVPAGIAAAAAGTIGLAQCAE